MLGEALLQAFPKGHGACLSLASSSQKIHNKNVQNQYMVVMTMINNMICAVFEVWNFVF